MAEGPLRRDAPARGPSQKTAMNQIGFDDIFERSLVLTDRRSERIEADRPARKLLDQSREEDPIEAIEARLINVESLEREARRIEQNPIGIAVTNG